MENNNLVACSGHRRKAIEELVKGREFANQLRRVINGVVVGGGGGGEEDGEQLVKKVLTSFANTLSILRNSSSESDEGYDHVLSRGINPTNSEDSLESNCKSSTVKERRGCYKRRRTTQASEKESETPVEDGHQWRKYGQKTILNCKHPRNYYRCTHKFDQGCQATKQVQRVQDEPPLYRTTYYGQHTCRNLLNPEIILDSNSPSNSSVILSFDNTLPTKQGCPFLSSSFPSSSSSSAAVKTECKEEIPSSSSNDYVLSSELTFDHSKPVTLSSNLDSDDGISDVLFDPAQLDNPFEPFFEFC